jgi:tRNA wybutosine-synthesizing protein 3
MCIKQICENQFLPREKTAGKMVTADFDKQKEETLRKLVLCDKSKKGGVDSDILSLVNLINSFDDFYTTSSCSGRIMIIDKAEKRKDLSKWVFTSHKPIAMRQYSSIFSRKYSSSREFQAASLWLMEEPAILHICCRNMASANRMLKIIRDVSFKRSGIISASKRIVLEILDTEKMETIIAKKGVLYLKGKYAKVLVEEANTKLRSTKLKIKKLYSVLKKTKLN